MSDGCAKGRVNCLSQQDICGSMSRRNTAIPRSVSFDAFN